MRNVSHITPESSSQPEVSDRRLAWLSSVASGTVDKSVQRGRLGEIDALRGVAIVMMVIYHLMWDLLFFGVLTNVALQQGFWKYFQRTTASTFIFLVGVSLVVSHQGAASQHADPFRKYLQRGAKIFGWGMMLTVIVRMADIGRIDFGVLHLIGLAIILAYPFLHYRWFNIALWALLNGVGYLLQPLQVDTFWLVWLGLKPVNYTYLDYFPLVPWFGVVLLGIGVGNLLYKKKQRTFVLPDLSNVMPVQWLQQLGRHSLTIYLLHQPLLFVLLFALFWFLS